MTQFNNIIQGSFPGSKPHASVLLQAKIGSQYAGNSTGYQIDSRRLNLISTGKPLPEGVLQKMGSIFRTDFSNVRIHTGREAESIGALAFTTGNDIYFATGQYNPNTPRGQQLLGHELTHVIQQKSGRINNPFGNEIAVVNDPRLEAEAERMGVQSIKGNSKNSIIQPAGIDWEPLINTLLVGVWSLAYMEVFKSNGFWERTEHNTYLWHAERPDRTQYIYTREEYKQRFNYYSYPVFTRKGFLEQTGATAYTFHAGDPDLTDYVDTGQTHQRGTNPYQYRVFTRIGFFEIDRHGTYTWHNGAPNPANFFNTGNQRQRNTNPYQYNIYTQITVNDIQNWLQHTGGNYLNTNNPSFHFKTTNRYRRGEGTYRYYWNNSVNIRGAIFGFGTNLHYGRRYNGGLGSSWLQGGPQGLSINAQNNPIRAQLQRRLRVLTNTNYGTNYAV